MERCFKLNKITVMNLGEAIIVQYLPYKTSRI